MTVTDPGAASSDADYDPFGAPVATAAPVATVPAPAPVPEQASEPEPRLPADDGAHPGPDQPANSTVHMAPEQLRVFDELLAVGGARPFAPVSIVDELRGRIEAGTAFSMERWTERSLWMGKSQLATVLRCEGQLAADTAEVCERKIPASTATGIIVHRAIQIAHTHPGRTVDEYIRLATAGSLTEESFAEFWREAPEHTQSDCHVNAVSRVAGFLDSFPPLDSTWTPRFEESIQARIGRLTLSVKPDLILGRPKANGRQTMFITDVKSGELNDTHFAEAHFYALVATLRFGSPPFRSAVYSLSSGDWTDPDVTATTLRDAAERVVEGVNRYVETLTESRPLRLAPGRHCAWCPAAENCPARSAWEMAGRPEDTTPFIVDPPRAAVPTPALELPLDIEAGAAPAAAPVVPGPAASAPAAPDTDDPWAL